MNETALQTIDGTVLAPEPVRPTMIRPLATPDEALEAWQAFQALKAKLVTADDIQVIQGRNTTKKSGWRKIAAAFGLDTELISEERNDRQIPGLGAYGFTVETTVRAIAPNGRHADGVGSCDSAESRFKKNSDHLEHDVRSTAYTRACNRAISDLVGGGEVSAEEMKAETRMSAERAKELLEQFVVSCDKQGVYFDYPTLARLLLQNADDLRRAFKHFKSQGEATEDSTPDEAPDDE